MSSRNFTDRGLLFLPTAATLWLAASVNAATIVIDLPPVEVHLCTVRIESDAFIVALHRETEPVIAFVGRGRP